MAKTLRIGLWIGGAFILMGTVSCNLVKISNPTEAGAPTAPIITGEAVTTGETGATPVPANPPAPTNKDGAEVILIPWGTFWMGSEADIELAGEDEMPRHEVTLNGFYIYTHEVTNGMYAQCVAAGACDPVTALESGPTRHYGDTVFEDFPVVGADWNMADDYCTWAGGRLPTEAEWERAAGGVDSLIYPWGEAEPTCDRVNMLGCAVPPDTVAVGSYLLGNSPEEVWDMSGNAWEWVHDWYADDYYTFSTGFNPLGPYSYQDEDNPLKVIRGGGLFSEPGKMRAAEREALNPYHAYDDVGFRCVTPPGDPLPTAYIPTRDRHERVPGGRDGGERADDPGSGDWIAVGTMLTSCPTSSGQIYVLIAADSSVPGLTWDVSVEGTPFSCTYNETAHALLCTGPEPVAPFSLTTYYVEIHTSLPGGHYSGYVARPADCTAPPPDSFSYDYDCPRDGMFAITFHHDPPITWDYTKVGGEPMPCWTVSPGETACLAHDIRYGDYYDFSLHGYSADGTEYLFDFPVPVRTDCAGTARYLDISPFCFEDVPSVQLMLGDIWPPLLSVSEMGVPLTDCFAMAPGVWFCGPLTNPAGTSVEIQVCTEGLECQNPIITVPSCPGTTGFPGFTIEGSCFESESEGSIPSASIHIWPTDRHIVSATQGSGTNPLNCMDWGDGWYMCPGVRGASTDISMIDFCLDDGSCDGDWLDIPDCSAPPETGEGAWRISSIGCHNELMIYFQIDTGYEWLVPGADFIYNDNDGHTTYACSVNPSTPGRIYCAGPGPLPSGPLEMCIMEPGHTTYTCQTFTDFPAWVGGIPSCAPEVPPEEPPDEPPPPPSCSDYTDESSCVDAGCDWKGGGCYGTPSPALTLNTKGGLVYILQQIYLLGDRIIDPGFNIFALFRGK